MSLDDLRALALALMLAEARRMEMLDDDVRQALGMRARRGRLRLDDLACRLVQLIDSSDIWRVRALSARRRVTRPGWRPQVRRAVA